MPNWKPTKRIMCQGCSRIVFSKNDYCFKCNDKLYYDVTIKGDLLNV